MKTIKNWRIGLLFLFTICLAACNKYEYVIDVDDYGIIKIEDGVIKLVGDKYGTYVPGNSERIRELKLDTDGRRVWYYINAYEDDDYQTYYIKEIEPVEVATPQFVTDINATGIAVDNAKVIDIFGNLTNGYINLGIHFHKNTDGKKDTFSLLSTGQPDENGELIIRICHNNNGGNSGGMYYSYYLYSIPAESLPGYTDGTLKSVSFQYETEKETVNKRWFMDWMQQPVPTD